MEVMDKIIGKGLIFPLEINEKGGVNTYTGIPLIRASILHIVNWPIAQRFYHEQYGCRIEECLEEPSDGVTHLMMKHFIIEALNRWEPRVGRNRITIIESPDRSIVNIQIIYQITGTEQIDTFVFPFYKDIIN